MVIGIDSSCIENGRRTGLYTYLTSILENLPKIAPENKYRLYFKNKIPSEKIIKNDCFEAKLLKKPSFLSWTRKPLWNTYCLPLELIKNKVDVFYSPSYTLPVFWSPVKSIVGLHDISYESHPEWFAKDFLETIQRKSRLSAHKANLIITNSNFCKSEIAKYYGVSKKKVFVVYPGVNKHFKSINTPGKTSISNKYKIRKPFILSVGAFYPRRNIPGLIRAFKLVANKIKDYQLVLIGYDQLFAQENIDNLITKTNRELGDRKIIHKDFISDNELEYLFKNAELFICLSNYEGFGSFAMLEAMVYKCPMVTVKASSIPELVGNTAIYTSHDKIQQIADSILNTLKDKKLRSQMSNLASDRIKMFSTENMTKQFIKACEYAYRN